ncbi:MAG: hypothetical protein Q6K81_06820, partial [Gloeomargarita sp. DG02_5_bins_242]
VGQRVAELQYDYLILLDDPEILPLAAAARPVPVILCPDHEQMVQQLQNLLQPGDRVLVKASHSVGLDRVVQALTQSR